MVIRQKVRIPTSRLHLFGTLPQQQIAEDRITYAEVLLPLGRKPMAWILGETEPFVLGCNSLEWKFFFAKLEVQRDRVCYEIPQSPIFLTKLL